jgi:hydrogenase-1 operon protein HyaF
MTLVSIPSNDLNLADAILFEVSVKLKALADHNESAVIELRGLPLTPNDLEVLDAALGRGEVAAEIHVSGQSTVQETAWSGVWRVRHHTADGGLSADQINICFVPDILSARYEDVRDASVRLGNALQKNMEITGSVANGGNAL